MKTYFFALIFLFVYISAHSQVDKGIFKEYKPGFYENTILKDVRKEEESVKPARTYFKASFEGIIIPNDTNKYERIKHTPTLSQGNTGTCWCFATTSFMEAEVIRIHKKPIKLSEMYTVYWEYVDRAVDFVQTRGNTYFNEGSEASSIPVVWKKYGIVPLEAYSGKLPEQKFHSHRQMVADMIQFLEQVKQEQHWDTEYVKSTIQSILNKYMGTPPTTFTYQNKSYTPQTFLAEVIQIIPDDYVNFMSTASQKFNQKGELIEADNWRHYDDYYNVNCEDFTKLAINALKKGYSVCICGDISEPGIDSFNEAAIIPDFDIPFSYINDFSRQMRLSNESTTDDHCMHLVGWFNDGKFTWFLTKDSGAGGFDGPNKGYRFIREDFVKLKMMNIMVHKEGARGLLDTIIK